MKPFLQKRFSNGGFATLAVVIIVGGLAVLAGALLSHNIFQYSNQTAVSVEKNNAMRVLATAINILQTQLTDPNGATVTLTVSGNNVLVAMAPTTLTSLGANATPFASTTGTQVGNFAISYNLCNDGPSASPPPLASSNETAINTLASCQNIMKPQIQFNSVSLRGSAYELTVVASLTLPNGNLFSMSTQINVTNQIPLPSCSITASPATVIVNNPVSLQITLNGVFVSGVLNGTAFSPPAAPAPPQYTAPVTPTSTGTLTYTGSVTDPRGNTIACNVSVTVNPASCVQTYNSAPIYEVFHELLGRDPTSAELTLYLPAVAQGTMSLNYVMQTIRSTAEYADIAQRRGWFGEDVNGLYRTYDINPLLRDVNNNPIPGTSYATLSNIVTEANRTLLTGDLTCGTKSPPNTSSGHFPCRQIQNYDANGSGTFNMIWATGMYLDHETPLWLATSSYFRASIVPTATPDQTPLNELYNRVLGRNPKPTELADAYTIITQAQAIGNEVIDFEGEGFAGLRKLEYVLRSSAEYATNGGALGEAVTAIIRTNLSRLPNSGEVATWVANITTNGYGLWWIAQTIQSQSEYSTLWTSSCAAPSNPTKCRFTESGPPELLRACGTHVC